MTQPKRVSASIRLAAGFAAAACAALFAAAPASAAPAEAQTASPAFAARNLGISMQVQQYDQWCWVASGNTIATYLGHGTSQNTFCDLARGYPTSYQCPNQPGYLSWDQRAFSALGVSPGYESGAVSWSTIVSNIDAGHPMETGISWTSGGGHAEVIYGYDSGSQSIYFGDPWPSDNRYNLMSYNAYRSNGQFYWDDTLYNIGA
ncbi:papain-like cysteine protease family protein [Labedaea rhizosphaerae]|uniref:Papain like cysteine protease AvrRpt2 n=1 Tax=Labedaea rhizosphaerae TaxID=598644 RepID=A0A4R6SIJ4_LABRH|nr:papain-like cysteine protease family protein [Labedaea rhizosphaerae]TDQ01420.1 papain like cysteine protease AvrRpt2 [Labedaea rhizosphaerae]